MVKSVFIIVYAAWGSFQVVMEMLNYTLSLAMEKNDQLVLNVKTRMNLVQVN